MKHNSEQQEPVEEQPITQKEIVIDQSKLYQYREKLRMDQNLIAGLAGGLLVSVLCAIVWAVITVVTNYQIGYMAIALGLAVGVAVRYFGKGIDQIFRILGMSLALFGCLLGNYLSMIGFFANEASIPFINALTAIQIRFIPEILMDGFSPMDVLFYGLAIYQAYKFSGREITGEEMVNVSTN